MYSIPMQMLLILVLVIVNGVLAMSEAAFVAARKARLKGWANEGNAKAAAALELANTPNLFLSTAQIGITAVGILSGAIGGTTIAKTLAIQLGQISWLAPYSEAVAVAIVVICITYLSLVIGELVPKRLALHSSERIACAVAGPMRTLSRITSPIIHLLSLSTEFVLRAFGVLTSAEPPVTEGEIKVLIEQATQAGVFEETEQDMLEGVFRLNDRRIGALMTPRTDIAWLSIDDTVDEIRHLVSSERHNLFPVCQGDLDNVLGVVRAKDLLVTSLASQSIDLKEALHAPIFIPESTLASNVLELFKKSELHLALVIDEYGGLQGMVTINDILEEIVGDIEMDRPQAVQRQDGTWLFDGMLPVHDFKEILRIKSLPGEEREHYQTLGGFIMMRLGRVPAVTDSFQWGGLRFEVMDVDGRRVDKVLVVQVGPDTTSSDT